MGAPAQYGAAAERLPLRDAHFMNKSQLVGQSVPGS